MYTFKSRVRYSETDETGCLGLDAILTISRTVQILNQKTWGLA